MAPKVVGQMNLIFNKVVIFNTWLQILFFLLLLLSLFPACFEGFLYSASEMHALLDSGQVTDLCHCPAAA